MAILNRTEDFSEQRKVFEVTGGATPTGSTGFIAIVPYNCVIEAAQVAALGLSGAPNMAINVQRFIAGTGYTTFPVAIGTSNVLQSLGTSGLAVGGSGMLLVTTGASNVGNTLGILLANDVLSWQTGVANSAVTGFSIGVVLRPLQDIKKHFGII